MDIKKDVKDQFGRSADHYVESMGHRAGWDLKKMIEMANPKGDELVLDVATGGGHMANALAPHVKKVTALDLTPEMLAAAKKFIKANGHFNVAFVEGDAEQLPFEDESFDLVTCRIAPHHFPNVESFVAEVHRVLKYGGKFLLDDNVAPEVDAYDEFYNKIEKLRDYSHYRAWKKTEWITMLETKGFEIQALHRFEKRFSFDSWCDRMNMPSSEKQALTEIIRNASDQVKDRFRVELEDRKVIAFVGEAALVNAVKR
ncbi:methyltransferase domain-containing protein [Radiobacillus sp. PE A8.2]|uniref:class I SAM-dependent methyltransferase n=1 Tax=Radiobacillus sp. PE A8.2 TaxID=3380349 RepID=UPI00388D1808